jgi:hypothetical protein
MPKASRFSGALKAPEFDAAAARHAGLQDAALDAARAVLVGGSTLEDAGTAARFSRQYVYKLCRLLHADAVPAGWIAGFVSLPPVMMKQVRAMERQARQQWEARPAAKKRPANPKESE